MSVQTSDVSSGKQLKGGKWGLFIVSNLEQPTGDGGTAGVAVLKEGGESRPGISDTSQRHTLESNAPVISERGPDSPFDRSIKVIDSESHERVLDTKPGDLAGTAVNLAAEAVARGARVLFVGANSARCHAISDAVSNAGLSEIALNLEAKGGIAVVVQELRNTLQQGPPSQSEFHDPRKQLAEFEERCNAHSRALAGEIRNTGVTGYEAISTVLTSGPTHLHTVDFSGLPLREWDRAGFERATAVASELDECLRAGGYPGNNPWRGAAASSQKTPPGREIGEQALKLLSNVRSELSGFLSNLGFDPNITENDADKILQGLKLIDSLETDNGEELKLVNLRASATWIRERDQILDGLEIQLQLAEAGKRLEGKVDLDKLRKVDLKAASHAVMTYQGKNAFSRVFDSEYGIARKNLERVARMPERVEDVVKVLGPLDRLQQLLHRSDEHVDRWERLFPEGRGGAPDDLTMWRRRAQVSHALIELFALGDSLGDADRRTLLTHFKKPENLYGQSIKLQEMCSLVTDYKQLRALALADIGFSEKDLESGFYSKSFADQEKKLRAMTSGAESWIAWQKFVDVAERAKVEGLDPLVSHLLEGRVTRPILATGLKQAWFKSLAEEFSSSRPGVEEEGRERTDLVRRLILADAQVRSENAVSTAQRHWNESPRYIVGGQSSALYRLISEDAPAQSVESLFEKAPRAVQQAKPFIIADEVSAAKITAASPLQFDFVILDDGVSLAMEHPLRTKAVVRRVYQLTGDPMAVTLSRNDEVKSSNAAPAEELPRADWRLPSVSTAPVKDLFQAHLKRILESELGITVHTDVKTPQGIVDLAVSNGNGSGEYKVSILVDGRNAQAIHAALDREKSREEACIAISAQQPRREWILDWCRHPEASKKEFISAVQRAIRQEEPCAQMETERHISREPLQPEHLALLRPYQKASVDLTHLKGLQRSQGNLRPSEVADALMKIVSQEGPIHRDELAQRFLQSCGLKTLSESMALQIVEGEQAALRQKKLVVRNDFLYSPDAEQTLYPRMRGDLSGTLARFERIPGEELEAAICLVVKRSCGISRKELPAQLFRAFGYKGVPFGADAIVERELTELLSAKVLTEEGGMLALGERARLT